MPIVDYSGAVAEGVGDVLTGSSSTADLDQTLTGIENGLLNTNVSLNALVDYYNELAEAYEKVQAQYQRAEGQVVSAATGAPSHVPGIAKALKATAIAAGAHGANDSTAPSLLGNLQGLSQAIAVHMAKIYQSSQSYAENESRTVSRFGNLNPSAPVPSASSTGPVGSVDRPVHWN